MGYKTSHTKFPRTIPGDRLTMLQAVELYQNNSLPNLALRADQVARRLHPANIRTYVIERNINYTNVCVTRCSFCGFSVSPGDQRSYTLTPEQICAKITPLRDLGGTQILLQGGMNPDLPLGWYENMLGEIKNRFPSLHIHAFSPPEIVFLAKKFDLSLSDILVRLRRVGLDTLPGGGAEILVDRVRRQIAPAKCSTDEWLEVIRQAHRLGMCTSATMMFGHIETLSERIEHLDKIRQLQDESLSRLQKDPAAGYFTAFTCWPFQPGRTRLNKWEKYLPGKAQTRAENQLLLAGAFEQLKMTSLARLYLDNIKNIQASWVTQGPKIGQLSLLMGCNDLGSLMMEENVVSAAGTTFQMELNQLRQIIHTAGFLSVQRDYYYQSVGNH